MTIPGRLMDALEQAVVHSQTIVRNLHDGILTFSSEGRLTSLNPGAAKILGVSATDVIGRCVSSFFDLRQLPLDSTAEDSDRHCAALEVLLREDKLELPLEHIQDEQTFVELTITVNNPHEEGYTCLLRDITDRRHVEEHLFEEKELAQTTLESIADGVITTDRQGRIRYMNAVAVQLNGKPLQQAIGQPLHIAPGRICFEITETAAMSNLEQAGQFIRELKRKGCRFALDDFGSGLSSFGYLKNLAVDFVKIDGSFIRDIDQRAVDREIVEAITSIARVMGLKSIAEFVETAAALDLLREIGVDYAQGYHVARPMPLDDYPDLQRLAQASMPAAKASGK